MSAETDKQSPLAVAGPISTNSAAVEALLKPARRGWQSWTGWLLVALIALFLPVIISDRLWLGIAVQGVTLAIAAIGLNVLTGYTGLASLGHAFFLGVGAYAAAFFGGNLGWSFFLWLPLSGIVAALVGLLVGALTLRFRGFYLAVVTLGLVAIGIHVFTNLKDLSGGSSGRAFPAPAIGDFKWQESVSALGPLNLSRDDKYYYLALLVLVLAGLFVTNVGRTRMGRAFQAVRDREIAAELMGINAAWAKIRAFVLSATLAGLSGALFASYFRQVQPDFWSLDLSIEFVAMIIIGGIATVGGAVLGALLVTALPQLVSLISDKIPFIQQEAGGPGIAAADVSRIIYALFLGIFLLIEPGGLVGIFRRVRARLSRSRT